jgi:hypothetical protein
LTSVQKRWSGNGSPFFVGQNSKIADFLFEVKTSPTPLKVELLSLDQEYAAQIIVVADR